MRHAAGRRPAGRLGLGGREQPLHGGGREEASALGDEHALEACPVLEVEVQAAGRAHDRRVVGAGVVGRRGRARAMTPDRRRRPEAAGRDAERLEHVRRERLLVGRLGDPLDGGADDDVAEVRVAEAPGPARGVRERGRGHLGALGRERPVVVVGRLHRRAAEVRLEAGLADEDVVDRHGAPAGVDLEVGEQRRHRHAPLRVAALDQPRVERRGDRLAARADVPGVVGAHRVVATVHTRADQIQLHDAVAGDERGADRRDPVAVAEGGQLAHGARSCAHAISARSGMTARSGTS